MAFDVELTHTHHTRRHTELQKLTTAIKTNFLHFILNEYRTMGNGPHAAWPLAQYQIDVLTLLTMKISATTTTKNNGKVKMENDEE